MTGIGVWWRHSEDKTSLQHSPSDNFNSIYQYIPTSEWLGRSCFQPHTHTHRERERVKKLADHKYIYPLPHAVHVVWMFVYWLAFPLGLDCWGLKSSSSVSWDCSLFGEYNSSLEKSDACSQPKWPPSSAKQLASELKE